MIKFFPDTKIFVEIGPFQIAWYAVFIMTGAYIAYAISLRNLKKVGYKEVICQVLTGLTYEEECRRFNILNTGRTQLTANQVFHCRVEEKEDALVMWVNL